MKQIKQTRGLSTIRLYTAAIEQKPVIVYMADEPIGFGIIEEVTDKAVKIDNEYYMRDVCSFYVHDNSHKLLLSRHMTR